MASVHHHGSFLIGSVGPSDDLLIPLLKGLLFLLLQRALSLGLRELHWGVIALLALLLLRDREHTRELPVLVLQRSALFVDSFRLNWACFRLPSSRHILEGGQFGRARGALGFEDALPRRSFLWLATFSGNHCPRLSKSHTLSLAPRFN